MKTLFLLHGFGVTSRVWEPVAYDLSMRYEILIPDLPGHGQTAVPFEGIRKSAETIADMIREANLPKLNVAGWSMGGQVALELYDIIPERFGSLILVSSTPKFTSEGFENGYNLAAFKKFYKAIKSDRKDAMDDFYHLMFSKGEDPREHLGFLEGQTPSEETLVACMEGLRNEDQRKTLSKISVPTLILSGSEDKICSTGASQFMSGKIGKSKLAIFGGAGHALQLTRKEEFVDAIKKFIG